MKLQKKTKIRVFIVYTHTVHRDFSEVIVMFLVEKCVQ